MANAYRSVLKSGGGVQPTGDAVEANVLAGKTFSNADGVGKTGTMVNRGAVSETLAAGQSYTVPEGYHNGSGTVTAESGGTEFIPDGKLIDSSLNISDITVDHSYTVGTSYLYFNCKGTGVNGFTAAAAGHGSQTSSMQAKLFKNGAIVGTYTASIGSYGAESPVVTFNEDFDYLWIGGFSSGQSTIGTPSCKLKVTT